MSGSARSWKYRHEQDGPYPHGTYSLVRKIVIEQINDMYSDLITVVVSGTRRKLQCALEVISVGSASSWGLENFFFFFFKRA